MRKSLLITLLLVSLILAPGCLTAKALFNLNGDLTPEQQQARIESFKGLVEAFGPLDIDNSKAAEWYAEQRTKFVKHLKKVEASWTFIEAWGNPTPEFKEYAEKAIDAVNAAITVLDGFLLPEEEPE